VPSLAAFALFFAAPLVRVVWLSVMRYDTTAIEYVGLKHFAAMAHDAMFWRSVVNSLMYALILVVFTIGGGLTIALHIQPMPHRVQDTMRLIFYLPSLVSAIVLTGAWKWIFDYRHGLLNYLLGFINVSPVLFFGHRLTAILAISLIVGVYSMGGMVLVFSVVMRSIPGEFFEAARADGATPRQIRLLIITPMIMRWILFYVLLQIISAFKIWETIWMMTDGGPMGYTATPLYDIYQTGFIRSAYGVASAKSLVLAAILLSIALVKNKVEGSMSIW